jgi:hypothetical protein
LDAKEIIVSCYTDKCKLLHLLCQWAFLIHETSLSHLFLHQLDEFPQREDNPDDENGKPNEPDRCGQPVNAHLDHSQLSPRSISFWLVFQALWMTSAARVIDIFDENVKQILYNWGDVHRRPVVR